MAGGHLQGGEQLSGRGTWHYPAREIYRCAILLDFGRQGVVDAAPAERALTGGIYNSLGRHRDSATTGIDALLAAVRATDSPIILESRTFYYEGNVSTHARIGEPTPWRDDEHSRLTVNLGRIVRALDSVLAAGR